MDKLVIVDMQVDFTTGILENTDATALLTGIDHLMRHFKGNLVLTRDMHDPNEFSKSIEGKLLPLHCDPSFGGSKLCRPIRDAFWTWHENNPEASYQIIPKSTFAPQADIFIPGEEIEDSDTIYICGTCTEICVVSTALKLRSEHPNNRIVCYANLCAGLTPKSHEAGLIVMENCLIEMEDYDYEMVD